MEEIKPCPFCGVKPEVSTEGCPDDNYAMTGRSVVCINDDCFFSGSWKRPNIENDIRLWNQRSLGPIVGWANPEGDVLSLTSFALSGERGRARYTIPLRAG